MLLFAGVHAAGLFLSDLYDTLARLTWIAAPAGVVVGPYYFAQGFRALRRKRLVLNTPTSTVRAAAVGPVEICGKAAGPYTLMSPLSQQTCFYYSVVAGEKHRQVEAMSTPFFVDDGTGRVMVDPRGAETVLPPVFTGFSADLSPNYARTFLDRHGLSDSEEGFEEYCICPGDDLYVLGTLQENPGTTWDHEGPPILSPAAADLQRREVLQSIHAPDGPGPYSPAQMASFDLTPRTLLMKSSGHPFLISRQSQRSVVQTLSFQSILYIWGGPILALLSLARLVAGLPTR